MMKRDMDLIRKMLLRIEAPSRGVLENDNDEDGQSNGVLEIDGVSTELVSQQKFYENRSMGEVFGEGFEAYRDDVIYYHMWLLEDSGLILSERNFGDLPRTMQDAVEFGIFNIFRYQGITVFLTWAGHEFLDAARDEKLWKKAMSIVGEKTGSVSVAVLVQLLSHLAKQMVGLNP